MTAKPTGSTLDTLTAQRDFPTWAMWRHGDGTWVATCTPIGSPPSRGSWLLWVFADNAEELVTRMRKGLPMDDNDWGRADRAIERLRSALASGCGVPRDAIRWSYGGVSGQRSATRIHINLDVPQGEDLAKMRMGHGGWAVRTAATTYRGQGAL